MALRSVRPWVTLVALAAAVVMSAPGIATSGAAAATPGAAASPVVKVSPGTGLVDLQNVTMTGTGYSPNVQIGTAQCRPGALVEADCDLGTLVYSRSDKHGAFTLKRFVRRLVTVGRTTFDCATTTAPDGCILGAANVGNLKQASGQTIFFDPTVPAKIPALTVSPNAKLVDHQLVTVTAKNYAPSTSVSVAQCVTKPPSGIGPACDFSTQRYVTVGVNGTFTVRNFVLERRQALFTKKGSQTLDCATAPGKCDIQTSGSGFGSSTPTQAALNFDPNAKPAVASVQVSPSSQLRDLQLVTLTGAGFTPGYALSIQQCVTGATKFPSCDGSTFRSVTAGFRGEFTTTFAVRRDIAAFVNGTGTTKIDCATKSGTCEVLVQGTQSQPPTKVALAFNPNVPAVVPAISADPNTGLRDNQSIKVSLRGFTPNQPVQIVECSAEAITEGGNQSYCDFTTNQSTSPTGSLTFRTTFVVHRVLGGQGGLVDCSARPGACVLIATETGGYYGGGIVVGKAPLKTVPGPTLPTIAFAKLTFATP